MTTKRRRNQKSSDYKELLREELRDQNTAAQYLTAALSEGEDTFLLAIRDVVEAQGGITPLAKKTSLNREGLYDMLSERGNPRLSSLTTILDSLGIAVKFQPKLTKRKAA